MLKLLLIAAALSSPASRGPSFRLLCTEKQHGGCTSSASCEKHQSKNTSLKITLPESVKIMEARGTMQDCVADACGDVRIANAREIEGGGWAMGHSSTDSLVIDGQAGFYTRTTIAASPAAGEVRFAFGICKRAG